MQTILKKTISNLFNSIGLKVMTATSYKKMLQDISSKQINLIEECQGLYSELVFTDLPPNEKRVQLMSELLGTGISEAIYIVNFLHKSLSLEGDVCEFGVAQGSTSALLANEIFCTEKNYGCLILLKVCQNPPKKIC